MKDNLNYRIAIAFVCGAVASWAWVSHAKNVTSEKSQTVSRSVVWTCENIAHVDVNHLESSEKFALLRLQHFCEGEQEAVAIQRFWENADKEGLNAVFEPLD